MTEFIPFSRDFYEPSAQAVAPALLGHWLVRNTGRGPAGGAIVETEAYLADDPACHAAPGMTPRNRVMFGPPGHGYVYFIYGRHFCVNAVCRPAGVGEAVLIRAVEPLFGLEWMRRCRSVRHERDLASGPGKLCQALQIDRTLDGVDFCASTSALFIARNSRVRLFRNRYGPVVITKRIGISRAAHLPLRFYLGKSSAVSG